MADDIVSRLCDIANRCWCAEKSQGEPVGQPFFRCQSCDDQLRAADEIERLQRWKVEACSVLADWDALYVGLGDRGELGQRKSAVVAAEMERLRAEVDLKGYRLDDALDEIERLRDLCDEAQAFITHDKNCGALMEWAKDCSCGYDEMWRKLNG